MRDLNPRHLQCKWSALASWANRPMVRMRGLEPPRLAAQPPQDCVYTSFTTSARWNIIACKHAILKCFVRMRGLGHKFSPTASLATPPPSFTLKNNFELLSPAFKSKHNLEIISLKSGFISVRMRGLEPPRPFTGTGTWSQRVYQFHHIRLNLYLIIHQLYT